MKHTLSVLVENEFGVLTRVSSLFSGRGFNIESLTVAETLDPSISMMTLTTTGDDAHVEQITKQLNKLVNVIKVKDVTSENPINRVLALIKVTLTAKSRIEIMKASQLFGAEMLDVDSRSAIIEVRGDEDKVASAVQFFKPYGIIEFIQTGNIAMQRSKKSMN